MVERHAATASKRDGEKSGARKQRISRLHDARAVRSRAALRQALLELIEGKQFEQIAIKEITDQAGVSYPVFFRQFASKEELLADLATEQVRNVLSRSTSAFDRGDPSSFADMCHYVEDHRTLWAALLTTGASAAMRAEFSRIANQVANSRPRVNPALPPDLVSELVVNAIFDILSWWLRQSADYPIGDVVKLLDIFVTRTFTRPIDITLERPATTAPTGT